jgi:riboflavin kinase/FMN adenylyltransferase
MLINSHHIKGIGRGKEIGFPTLNLFVPEDILLEDGIYSSWVIINGISYKGALHFGSIPTFNQKEKSMEVHLIDITDDNFPDTNDKIIEIDVVDKLRDIKRFIESEDLTEQIAQDVAKIKSMLKS